MRTAASGVIAIIAAIAAVARPACGQTGTELPPAGYGTLKQEDASIKFATPTLQVRILPLDERVIRLFAPDTYRGLAGLKLIKQAAVDSAARQYAISNPSLFIVTFFALEAGVEFQPDDVTITSRNRFFRPLAILPLGPRWGEQRLGQRETATAVYVYEPGIFVLEPMTVSYAGLESRAWNDALLRVLDEERAAVLGRAGGTGGR